jgi:hypothetical protein
MNEQQLAAVKQALEALEIVVVDVKTTPTAYEAHRQAITALQSIISQDALDKMAKNARELGLNYDTPLSAFVRSSDEDKAEVMERVIDKAIEAQKEKIGCVNHDCDKCKAAQEGRDWSLLEATQESLREHMAEIKRLKAAQPAPVQEPVAWVTGFYAGRCVIQTINPAAILPVGIALYTAPQPVPVKTYSGGKPWPVAPKPWVGLSEEEVEAYDDWADFQVGCGRQTLFDMVRDIEAKLKEKNHG